MNISEFARYAGVSKAAVSRYFNDGYLSEEKRTVIEKAIKETGYALSRPAHTVRTRITKLVGVIISKLSSDSIARIIEGISMVLSENGYEMLLVNTANHHKKRLNILRLMNYFNIGLLQNNSYLSDTIKLTAPDRYELFYAFYYIRNCVIVV